MASQASNDSPCDCSDCEKSSPEAQSRASPRESDGDEPELSSDVKELLNAASKVLGDHSSAGGNEVDVDSDSDQNNNEGEDLDPQAGPSDVPGEADLSGDPVEEDIQIVQPDKEWEVEAILGKRIYKHEVQYWVKWKDHPENSWEPERNLTACGELLAEFNKVWLKKQQEKKSGPGRGYTKSVLGVGRKRAKNPDSDSEEED